MRCLECAHLFAEHHKSNVLGANACAHAGCSCTGFRAEAVAQFNDKPLQSFASAKAELTRIVADLAPDDTVFMCVQRKTHEESPQVAYVSYSSGDTPLNLVIALLTMWIAKVCMPHMHFEGGPMSGEDAP